MTLISSQSASPQRPARAPRLRRRAPLSARRAWTSRTRCAIAATKTVHILRAPSERLARVSPRARSEGIRCSAAHCRVSNGGLGRARTALWRAAAASARRPTVPPGDETDDDAAAVRVVRETKPCVVYSGFGLEELTRHSFVVGSLKITGYPCAPCATMHSAACGARNAETETGALCRWRCSAAGSNSQLRASARRWPRAPAGEMVTSKGFREARALPESSD